MAAALFARRAEGHVDSPRVASAGLGRPGHPPPDEVLEVMALAGLDVSEHRSTTLTAADGGRGRPGGRHEPASRPGGGAPRTDVLDTGVPAEGAGAPG